MATFTVWNRTRPLRPVTWVCGLEEVLRREVVRHYADSLPEAAKSSLWAPDWGPGIWDMLLGGAGLRAKLTVVHAAEDMKTGDWAGILLANLPEGHFVVFVSADGDFTRESDGKALTPNLATLQKSRDGQLIRCCRPSKEEDLLKLVASWWPGAGTNHAWALWQQCGDNLTAAYQVCDTARRAGLPATDEALAYLSPRLEQAHWAEHVMAGRRREALDAGAYYSRDEQLKALGELNSLLSRARSYAQWSARGLGPDEIARKGISRYQQRLISPYAGRYGPEREIRCRKLLSVAEDALRSGAWEAVLETVAASW